MTDRKKRAKPMPSLDPAAFAAAAVRQPDPVRVATTRPPASGRGRPPPPRASPTAGKPPSREGKVQLNVWVTPETRRKLLHRKADTGESIEEMVSAAIDALLTRSPKP